MLCFITTFFLFSSLQDVERIYNDPLDEHASDTDEQKKDEGPTREHDTPQYEKREESEQVEKLRRGLRSSSN